jgi:hypothetical protein
MNSRVENPRSRTRTLRSALEVIAICDGDPGRLEGPCRDLPNGRRAALVRFDCANAIDAAFKGVVEVLVVDGTRSSPERLTALSFLRRERPRTRIYFFIDEKESPPRLELWEPASSTQSFASDCDAARMMLIISGREGTVVW